MRSHAKAATAGSIQRRAGRLGRPLRGAVVTPTFAAALCVVLSMLFAGVASAETVPLSRFGPDGSEATNFNRIGSVAVDQQSGDVYVLDGDVEALFKFGPAGEPIAFGGSNPDITDNRIDGIKPFTSATQKERTVAQVAVDSTSHTVYVTEEHGVRAFDFEGEPVEFSAGPGMGTNEIPGFTKLFGLAVDANGAIYAVDSAGSMSVYAATGAPLVTVPVAKESLNLAVGADGSVYLLQSVNSEGKAQPVARLSPSAFPVTESTTYTAGTFANPKSLYRIVGIAIDPASGHVYLLETNFNITYVRIYDEAGALVGSIGEPGTESEEFALGGAGQGLAVLGTPAEIGPGETIKFYVGDEEAEGGISQVALFGTKIIVGPPSISGLRVTGVTADSGVLRAEINPNTAPTTYRFEYGTEDCSVSACTSLPVGGAGIGDGTEEVAVSQAIFGLSAATTYHYRVVAENELGPPSEAAGTFTTQSGGLGFELSDQRVWEMVSPTDKHGARLEGTSFGMVQAAEDGNGLTYLSRGSIEAGPEGNRSFEASQVMAKRSAGGWASKDITPSNARTIPLTVGNQGEYKLFTPDLSTALLDPREGSALSPLATERTPYLREEASPPLFTPLLTGAEGVANVPAGREFGGNPDSATGAVGIAGADRDLEHVVLRSTVSLVEDPDAPPALYLWDAGQLEPLSILPESEGGTMPAPVQLGSGNGSVRNAVSEDGSRVFWSPGGYSSGSNGLTGLYLRDTAGEETVRLDTVQGGDGTGQARPLFQGANPSGTVVYFSDSQRLTADASPEGFDLYRCEIPAGNPAAGCATLTNLSGPATGGGESAEVQGLTSGMTEAGNRLYYVARGVLDSNPNELGEGAEPGEPNLYFWEEGAGGPRFIATLSEEDEPAWGGFYKVASEVSPTASPDGRYLAFMSNRKLTGQPNEDLVTGKPVEHVFVYDAALERLQCVSCNPTGSASRGQIGEGIAVSLVDSQELWAGQRVSAILPQPTANEASAASFYRPRVVFDSGLVFFNSLDSLVSADSNGQWDVYEFEPLGQGTCTASSGGSAVARSGGGCVSLVSSGAAEGESAFLDASPSGEDAFFLTPARLSVLDTDNELDVYDARVNGVAATLTPNAECLGEACQPAAIAPNDPTPASSAFKGQGNVKQSPRKRCAKGKRAVRRGGKSRCVARKHKKHRRAGQSRRAGR